ncbi:MAG: ATP-binding protein [Kiritimatiellae bacterium]|nr:ATP-binding protein [Kiritimatiellia bacterium]
MTIARNGYIDRLLESRGNGMVKVLVGLRRCGKSFLLFRLFKERLLAEGVPPGSIVEVALDARENAALRDPDTLGEALRARLAGVRGTAYVFLDEIQLVRSVNRTGLQPEQVAPEDAPFLATTFYDVLNGLAARPDTEVFVTGSNSKMLSRDVATQFRGRGDVIAVRPLSFAEFLPAHGGEKAEAWEAYATYGGMPAAALLTSDWARERYLKDLFRTVYLSDIVERLGIRDELRLDRLVDMLASAVGSLTNPARLSRAMGTAFREAPDPHTVKRDLDALEDAFLFAKADRWDVKGGRYLEYPSKWYATDVGLRNARLNFRQMEPTHIQENVLYNELSGRGWSVDVGVVPVETRKNGVYEKANHEIDFVLNRGFRRVYVQSAFRMDDPEKREAELLPLQKTGDFFRKVVVTGGFERPWMDEKGILHAGLVPFLLDSAILES